MDDTHEQRRRYLEETQGKPNDRGVYRCGCDFERTCEHHADLIDPPERVDRRMLKRRKMFVRELKAKQTSLLNDASR